MNGLVKGKKYYASKHFYRYIRPGAVRVDATSNNNNVFVSAYQHQQQGTHTIVLVNTSNSVQNITLGGANLPSSFTIFRSSATDNCANVGTYTTGNTLNLPARSLVTLQAGGTPLATASSSGARMQQDHTIPEPLKEEESRLALYPNPLNKESVTVDISAIKSSSKIQVNLKSMSGRLIGTYYVTGDKLEIKREDLPAKGIYIIEAITERGIETRKLLVE